jgi:diguanylate cyclase (GGDEF)-like protein
MSYRQSNDEIQKLIEKQIELPSPPAIAVQILKNVQDENASLQDLAKIISADPALTSKVLRVANSGFYAPRSGVTSVERALTVLGTNLIKNIALSFVITNDLRNNRDESFDFDYFWRRAVTSAVAAELLTTTLRQKNEDIFVTALFHDIGVLIMYLSQGDGYNLLLKERKATGTQLFSLERQAYGFDHQQLGATLVESWGLPEQIYLPIGYHHSNTDAPEEYRSTTEILRIADQLSSIYCEASAAEKVRLLQNEMVEMFELAPEQTLELVDQVATKSIEILEMFEIDPGDMKPYSQMLLEANEELGRLNLSYEQVVMELKESNEKSELLTQELLDANSRLKELVFRDGLTGLYNHRYFQEILTKELARAQRYQSSISLILFDIDFFKKVNDSYGHPAGDLVLMNIARVVENIIRPSDIAARYGGEEFTLILPETNEQGMRIFAERLRRSIEGIVTSAGGQQIKVTVSSGGVTCGPEQTQITKATLIDTADRALYMSKHNGRNRVTILKPGHDQE